jgi:hydroxymethylglutaryl-CoA synthase
MDSTRAAYFSLKKMKQTHNTLYYSWESIIMHLPMLFKEDELKFMLLTLLP